MDDIKQIIVDTLKERGDLAHLQAKIQECVAAALETQMAAPKPPLSGETYVLCEIIMEFLKYLGFNSTASVLATEAGFPPLSVSRDYLLRSIGIEPSSSSEELPLLYQMLAFCQQFGGVSAVVLPQEKNEKDEKTMLVPKKDKENNDSNNNNK